MKNLFYYLLLVGAFLCFVLYHPNAKADEESLWLTSGEWSQHNNEDAHHYRQNNTGVGLQYDLEPDMSLLAGWYNNSIHRESVYMGITWTPLYAGRAKFGAMYGMATGYDKYFPAVPIASLYGTYERKCYGINFYWLPTIVWAVQLKVKI